MDTNKDKMMAFLSSMTEEQAAAFMQMLTQQSVVEGPVTKVECHVDVVNVFAKVVDTQWFVATVNNYQYKEWSAWAFRETAIKSKPNQITEQEEDIFIFEFINEMLDKSDKGMKLQQATAQVMGFNFDIRYKAADTVSSAVTWVFDATGRGIEWVGQKVVDAGLWTQDHAPDAGNLAGKPVRWATDLANGAKGKVDDFKDAYKQVRDNKATE